MFGSRFVFTALSRSARGKAEPTPKTARRRLSMELLEDRCVPSTTNVFTLPIAANIAAERIQTLDGNLFFTTAAGEIGRITPTGQVTPNLAVAGADLAVGADGNLYTAFNNTVRQITPNGTVKDSAIPTPGAVAGSITAGPDGNLWFEETSVDQVGRLNPATGVITEYALSQFALYEAPAFGGISAGPDGNVWLTEPILNQIARITTNGAVTEFALSANALAAEQITAGPDGNVYFTQPGLPNSSTPIAPQIGRIIPNGQVTELTLPVTGGQLSFDSGITTGPDGNIYFDSSTGLGRITTTGQVTENLSPPPPFGVGLGITVGPDGNIWLADYGQVEQVIIGGTTAAAPTATTLTVSPNPAVFGEAIAVTATVTSPAGTPAGTVTFFDGGTAVASAPLDASGQATLKVSLGVGNHSLTASFAPTGAFAASTSAAVTETVNPTTPAATTTALSTSASSAVFGQTETLTATVTSPAGTPAGTVTFFDGSVVLGTATLSAAGQATLTVSLGTGAHSLTASFTPTGSFAASTSASVAETVNRAVTTTALSPSVSSVVTGQSVVLTATIVPVAPGAGTPTGTVTFKDGNVILGTATVIGGKATFTTSFASTGNHVITAAYSGDTNFVASAQTATEQVSAPVPLASTKTALVASAKSVRVGQTVTFTATVSGPSGTGTPTGTITFFVGNVAVATVKLNASGKASLTGQFSVAGNFTITAVYSGDSNFAASSQSLTEQVN